MSHGPRASHRPSSGLSQRTLFAWSLLAGLVLLAALAGPFFAGQIYTADDLGALHLPTRAFYHQQLARSEPFDWMPQLYSGFYLTGEGQAGMYHPWHLLLYRCLPLRVALCWEWLAAYPLMLLGAWLFLRRWLGRSDAAMFGSLVFTFSSFNLLHFVHPNAVAIVAHIPWLLWAIDIVLVDPDRRKAAWAQAAIALLTGSQLLLGYPQYVWFSLIAEAAYAGFVLTLAPTARKRLWSRLVIAKGCGLLVGGVQLLPTLDVFSHSARGSVDAAFAAWGSLHPWNLVQLVAPYAFVHRVVGQNTHELALYIGAVPLLLIVWLVVRRRRLGSLAPWAVACGGFGILALLLAFGKYAPIYRLQHCLPLVGSFRFPCRYVMLFQLACALLAAIGFVLLVREHRRSIGSHLAPRDEATSRGARRLLSSRDEATSRGAGRLLWRLTRIRAVWITTALGAIVALICLLLRGQPWMASVPAIMAGPLLLGTGALLLNLAASGSRAALIGLILLTAADLGVYGLSHAVYPGAMRLEPFVARIETPPDQPPGRVLASLVRFDERRLRTGNQITLAGWHRADGYTGLEPARQLDYHHLAALRAAGVRWVRRGETTADVEGLVEDDERWARVPRPLPRVRMISRVRWSDDPAGDLPRIDPETTALCEVPLVLPEATPGTATLLSDRPGSLHIRCDGSSPQLLVVAESFHPGWKATVDGKPQQALRINGDFLGCLVAPGRHHVRLEFHPDSLRRGWIATWAGLALVPVCFIGYRFGHCGARFQRAWHDEIVPHLFLRRSQANG